MKVVCRVLTLGVTADRPGVSMKILTGLVWVLTFEDRLGKILTVCDILSAVTQFLVASPPRVRTRGSML